MTLKEKVWFILNQYNGGVENNYAENMLYAIQEAERGNECYSIDSDCAVLVSENPHPYPKTVLIWTLAELLGRCIFYGTADLFQEDSPVPTESPTLLRGVRHLIYLWSQYTDLLTDELDEVVPIAAAHGWKSSRHEAGVKLRQLLVEAQVGVMKYEE